MWSGTEDHHKWALVNWGSVYKTKSQGGLGLRDPQIAGLLVGANIWWCCLTHSQEPWAKLWVAKYAPHWDCWELIRFSEEKLVITYGKQLGQVIL